MAKYALGPGGTFLADDKGGNAASEVAGESVAGYYDTYLAPAAKKTRTMQQGWDSDPIEVANLPPGMSPWKYSNSPQAQDADGFDAWDHVNPHPESNDLGGWGEAWKSVGRPIATAVAMYYGVGALGAAGGAGTAASTGAAASSAGWGSWAPSAISGGMTLAKGGSVGDALKNAGMAYIGGGVGSSVSGAVGGGVAGKLAGSVASAVATGRDPLAAVVSGGINAGVSGVTGSIDGFSDMAKADQSLINGVTGSLVGSAIHHGGSTQQAATPKMPEYITDDPKKIAIGGSALDMLQAQYNPETLRRLMESLGTSQNQGNKNVFSKEDLNFGTA